MKNLIITMALVILFAMLLCFQWEMNSRSWHSLNNEGQPLAVNMLCIKD